MANESKADDVTWSRDINWNMRIWIETSIVMVNRALTFVVDEDEVGFVKLEAEISL